MHEPTPAQPSEGNGSLLRADGAPTHSYEDHLDRLERALGLVTRLDAVFTELDLDERRKLLAERATRLQTRRFTVAVVGEFKRGKSTLINALLGHEVLPADPLPCSAALFRIIYGDAPAARVFFRNGEEKAIGIEFLREFGTKLAETWAETAAEVAEIVIEYPLKLCRNGVHVLDTPGLNDDKNMTGVTLTVLPFVDAAILVMMSDNPFSETEQAFIAERLLLEDVARLIIVINAMDRIQRPSDRKRVVENVTRRFADLLVPRVRERWSGDPKSREAALARLEQTEVYPVSSQQALEAKLRGNAQELEASGFPSLEATLQRLLVRERGGLTLAHTVSRILHSADEADRILDVRRSTLETRHTGLDAELEKLQYLVKNLRARGDASAREVLHGVHRLALDHARRGADETAKYASELASAAIDGVGIKPTDFSKSNLPTINSRISGAVTAAVAKAVTAGWDRFNKNLASATDEAASWLGKVLEQTREALDEAAAGIAGGRRRNKRVARQSVAEYLQHHSELTLTLPGDQSLSVAHADTWDAAFGFVVIIGGALAFATGGIGAVAAALLGTTGIYRLLESRIKSPLIVDFKKQCKEEVSNQLAKAVFADGLYKSFESSAADAFDRLMTDFGTEMGALLNDFSAVIQQLQERHVQNSRDVATQRRLIDHLESELDAVILGLQHLAELR